MRAFFRLLLVEDNPGDARLAQELLSEAGPGKFELVVAGTLQAALDRLEKETVCFDMALLDLSLPDSKGLETFLHLHQAFPQVPVVILTGLEDEKAGLEAVRQGAQDYLVKGEVDEKLLWRVIRYGMERHQMQEQIRDLSLRDELTGLYNRRGFLVLAEQQVRLACRHRDGFLMVAADLDFLKQINDTHGHAEGDRALRSVAEVLQATFRQSDIVARVGGDEFTVLAIHCVVDSAQRLTARLHEELKKVNEELRRNKSCAVSLSVGTAYIDAQRPISAEECLRQADVALYAEKRRSHPV